MDDLEFRRRLIAAPYEQADDLLEALEEKPERKKLQANLQELDQKIANAFAVDMPEGLTEQLILRQRIDHHNERQQKQKWYFAMAASLVLVVTATFALWPQPHSNLANYALAHVYHEPATLERIDERASLPQINAKLASYGVTANQELGHVYYANHCDFKGKRSLHMVLEHQGEKLSVFIVPGLNDFETKPESFSDDRFKGELATHQNTGLIVIGDNRNKVHSMQAHLKHSFDWGAI